MVLPTSWVTGQEPKGRGPCRKSLPPELARGLDPGRGEFFAEIRYPRHLLASVCLTAAVPVLKLSTLSSEPEILHSAG